MRMTRCSAAWAAAAIFLIVVKAPAQTDQKAEVVPTDQKSGVVSIELRKKVEIAQGILRELFVIFPEVEGVAARYTGPRSALFAVVVNKRAPRSPGLTALLNDLASLNTALAFTKNKNFTFSVQSGLVETEPLKAFSVSVGGSTSNRAGCFEGTVGAAVEDASDPTIRGFLTCNHVAAAEGHVLCPNGPEGQKELVPATAKTECHGGQAIGSLVRRHPINVIPVVKNEADAAFVQAKDVDWNGCRICANGDFYKANESIASLPLRKCGAGSNYTENGVVEWPDVLVWVPFIPCGPTITFDHQIMVKGRFAAGGDSGSMAYDAYGKAVGMIFAGDEDDWTYLNPAYVVLDLLRVKLVKCVP